MLMWAVLCGLLIFEMIKYSKFLKKKSFETNLQNIATESFYCNVLQILYKGSLFTSRLGWRKSKSSPRRPRINTYSKFSISVTLLARMRPPDILQERLMMSETPAPWCWVPCNWWYMTRWFKSLRLVDEQKENHVLISLRKRSLFSILQACTHPCELMQVLVWLLSSLSSLSVSSHGHVLRWIDSLNICKHVCYKISVSSRDVFAFSLVWLTVCLLSLNATFCRWETSADSVLSLFILCGVFQGRLTGAWGMWWENKPHVRNTQIHTWLVTA